MSGFVAARFEDRVEIVTDGAVYQDDGTLVSIDRKMHVSRVAPLVVTGRGYNIPMVAKVITGIADACGSFDDTIDRLYRILEARKGTTVRNEAEFLIAGISERHGPVLLHFATLQVDGYPEAWTLQDLGDSVIAAGSEMPPPELYEGRSFKDFGPDILKLARRQKGINPARPELPPVYGIGGRIDHTVVTNSQIVVECVHRWSDTIGEKINPALDAAAA